MTEIFLSGVEQRANMFTLTCRIAGANGKGEAHLDLLRVVGDWLMSDFNITPPTK